MHLPSSEENSSPSNMSGNTAEQEPDFSEFMWMAEEDLESFDNEVIQEVQERVQRHFLRGNSDGRGEEEVFLQQMLEEEEARDTVYFRQQHPGQDRNMPALQNQFQRLQMMHLQQQQRLQRQQQNGRNISMMMQQQNGHNIAAPMPQRNAVVNAAVQLQNGHNSSAQSSDFKLNPEAAVFVPRVDGTPSAGSDCPVTGLGSDNNGPSPSA